MSRPRSQDVEDRWFVGGVESDSEHESEESVRESEESMRSREQAKRKATELRENKQREDLRRDDGN